MLRKEADFNIEDRIAMDIVSTSQVIKSLVERFEDSICQEVLVKSFNKGIAQADIEREVEIGDEMVILKLKRM